MNNQLANKANSLLSANIEQNSNCLTSPIIKSRSFVSRIGIPNPGRDAVTIIPVGGIGRIGMNWTLYGYDGRWLLVDAGIAFPEKDNPDGIEALVPDISTLQDIIPNIDGLVITHAHEDHVGSIHRLWPHKINCPIYATPFASMFIINRFENEEDYRQLRIHQFQVGSRFKVGSFDLQSIRMTHSVPEPVALAIRTPVGNILHTGDWKYDPNPLVGEAMDWESLTKLGEEGITAILCDSTNADKELPLSSEWQVRQAYQEIFQKDPGMVVASFFASNVARIVSACLSARDSGRKIAIAGRSMIGNFEIAQHLNMIPELGDISQYVLKDVSDLKSLHKSEMALICTGTQGETKAALARLSRGEYRYPSVDQGDTLLMSSRIIPGNEESVEKVLSALRQKKMTVMGSHDKISSHPIHVSGHPGRQELRMMHQAIQAKFVIPVHGEQQHLQAHAELALSFPSTQKAPILQEGSVIKVNKDKLEILNNVDIPVLGLMNAQEDRYEAKAKLTQRYS